MELDFLIVGQGLAGSLLAWRLLQRNAKVLIVDNGQENASCVAAGLINPITGMRFAKTAHVDTLLPSAKVCYAELSAFFQQPFFIEKPLLRVFRNAEQADAALRRLSDPGYNAFLDTIYASEQLLQGVTMPYGGLLQKQCGHLLTAPLLYCLKRYFIAHNCYRQAPFTYADLQVSSRLRWQDVSPQQVIFCEGYRVLENPWFSWLPLQPVKGEILTLQTDVELPEHIINDGHWLLPLDKQCFRVGATFDRNSTSTLTSATSLRELLAVLRRIAKPLAEHATLYQHQANIRPCSLDRQPFIGRHPQWSQFSVFNGFGAKGSLSVPWYSEHFAEHLLTGAMLDQTCAINRDQVRRFYRYS